MFSYDIIQTPSFKIDIKTIDEIFNSVHNTVKKEQNGVLNMVFLSKDSIKNLNNKYRGIDKITDVLSFHYFDSFKNLESEKVVGEIVMCEEEVISQGKEYKLGSEKEFYKLLIHSILHILGYDHEEDSDYKVMQSLEDEIWDSLNLD